MKMLDVIQSHTHTVIFLLMNIIRSFQESCKIHARYLIYKYKRIMHYKPRSSQESYIINQDPVRTLARFWSGHHGQIFHGSITNDLS